MFRKILWKSHPQQGIYCFEMTSRHFSIQEASDLIQEPMIPQVLIVEFVKISDKSIEFLIEIGGI